MNNTQQPYKINISAKMTSTFSNHRKYLDNIVLPNLSIFIKSYEQEEKEQQKNVRNSSRLFINAMITMNHIPDYMFWEWKDALEKINIRNEKDFYKHLITIDEFSFMKDVREVANAAKHCVTTNKKKMNAAEIAESNLQMEMELTPDGKGGFMRSVKTKSSISHETYYEKNSDLALKAWNFWVGYSFENYKDKIIG